MSFVNAQAKNEGKKEKVLKDAKKIIKDKKTLTNFEKLLTVMESYDRSVKRCKDDPELKKIQRREKRDQRRSSLLSPCPR